MLVSKQLSGLFDQAMQTGVNDSLSLAFAKVYRYGVEAAREEMLPYFDDEGATDYDLLVCEEWAYRDHIAPILESHIGHWLMDWFYANPPEGYMVFEQWLDDIAYNNLLGGAL